jgi:hypothetical protein
LTESGKTELKELGQRYKSRLSDLLDEPYNEENIIVTNNNANVWFIKIQTTHNM